MDDFSRPRAWVNLGLASDEPNAEQARPRVAARGPSSPQAGLEPVALAAAPYLTRGVELDALLVAIVDTIVDRLAAERGTLYLVDGRTRTLSSVVAHLPELERIRLDFGQGIAGTVAAEGRILNVASPADDPRFDPTLISGPASPPARCWRSRSATAAVRSLVCCSCSTPRAGASARRTNAARSRWPARLDRCSRPPASTPICALARGPLELGAEARPQPGPSYTFNQIVGESAAMQSVYAIVRKAAGTQATVLITGETGTGKELIARAVHVNSTRRSGPFVKVDCTTLPEALIENELFGDERGAFTGADRATHGKVEAARGGTLFVDEIGELPLPLQGKLLRVLQDREFERVGGTETIVADIRVICATHRDLPAMIDAGSFREDLYYRIRVVPIELPPLRERGRADLLRLVEHFVDRYAKRHGRPIRRVTEAALARLLAHHFPGNIRELGIVFTPRPRLKIVSNLRWCSATAAPLTPRICHSCAAAPAAAVLVRG